MHQKFGYNVNVHYCGTNYENYNYLLRFSMILETNIMKNNNKMLSKKHHKYMIVAVSVYLHIYYLFLYTFLFDIRPSNCK